MGFTADEISEQELSASTGTVSGGETSGDTLLSGAVA